MPSVLVPHALTTATRVKERLSIPVLTTTWDNLLERLINGATDFIERMSGGRRYKETTYTSEVFSGGDGLQKMVTLNNFPVTALSAAQYRAGVPGSPVWTSFDTSEFELVADREPRRIRIYSACPAGQNNCSRTSSSIFSCKCTFSTPSLTGLGKTCASSTGQATLTTFDKVALPSKSVCLKR